MRELLSSTQVCGGGGGGRGGRFQKERKGRWTAIRKPLRCLMSREWQTRQTRHPFSHADVGRLLNRRRWDTVTFGRLLPHFSPASKHSNSRSVCHFKYARVSFQFGFFFSFSLEQPTFFFGWGGAFESISGKLTINSILPSLHIPPALHLRERHRRCLFSLSDSQALSAGREHSDGVPPQAVPSLEAPSLTAWR